MSLAGFKKTINKANQLVSEKIGGAKGTELDDRFVDMEKKIDVMCKLMDELLTKTHELLQPNPASRAKLSAAKSISKIRGTSSNQLYPQPEGQLGECMIKYGKDLGDNSLFGQALVEVGETYKQMAEVKYSMEDNVKQNFIEPIQHLQNKDLKEVQLHRSKMNSRRLDYDFKKRKGKGPGYEEELKSAEEKFDESRVLTESAMQNLLDNEVEQVLQLSAFIEAELQYHTQSADILKALQDSLKKKCNGTSSKAASHYACKPVRASSKSDKSSNHESDTYSDTSSQGKRSASNLFDSGYSAGSQAAYCEALFDFTAENDTELSFWTGERIELLSHVDENWLQGSLRGRSGFFPRNYVNIIVDLP